MPPLTTTTSSPPTSTSAQQQQIPLTRLLTHLDTTLFSSSTSTFNNSPAHRARIATNLEHARALYLTLEKKGLNVTKRDSFSKRDGGLVEELKGLREWIGRLEGRLRELGEMDDDDDGDSGSESEDEEAEDLLRVYGPARKAFEGGGAGLDVGVRSQEGEEEEEEMESQGQEEQRREQQQQPQELRARKGLSAKDNFSAASTSARETLFQNRSPQPSTSQAETDGIQKTETLMSHNRTEQEALTTGLLGLASALKQSSINFSSSLEAERDVLKRAEGGLDKSAAGMDAAGKRMGMLRRMSEGQGWWGRIKLYAFIFGLWVACFLLVFIGPKLRF